jgi:hypothetical protein
MITFNNYKQSHFLQAIDITIPSCSVVFLQKEFCLKEKGCDGEILFEQFPIHFAKKSFQKNIFTKLNVGNLFEKNLTLQENMKIIAEVFDSSLIWHLPLKYFQIPKNLWNKKVKNLEQSLVLACEISTLLFCRQKILQLNVPLLPENFMQNVKNIIESKAMHGNSIIFYSGIKLNISNEIKISL